MMKKCLIFALSLLLICLASCGSAAQVPIDGYFWEMTTVQGDGDGSVVACAPGSDAGGEGAEELVLLCTAEAGKLTLTDASSNQSYTGTYSVMRKSPDGTIYSVRIGETEGNAVTGMTTYLDKSQSPTLIISIGEYAINFFSSDE